MFRISDFNPQLPRLWVLNAFENMMKLQTFFQKNTKQNKKMINVCPRALWRQGSHLFCFTSEVTSWYLKCNGSSGHVFND